MTRLSGAGDRLSVIYVEDEALISMVVGMALEEAGFEVSCFADGKSAVLALETRARRYRALVTDVRLPEVDGWEIAKRAREITPHISVIYVSGDSAGEWAVKGVANSIMLQKPFANANLVTALDKLTS